MFIYNTSNIQFYLRINMKLTAGGTSTDSSSTKAILIFTPPEILLDTPFNMGCYNISNHEISDVDDQSSEMTPASCILTCAEKGARYRLAGIKPLSRVIGLMLLDTKTGGLLLLLACNYVIMYVIIPLGIQNGNKCFCLTSLQSFEYIHEATYCSASCTSMGVNYPCGAQNALNVYVAGM